MRFLFAVMAALGLSLVLFSSSPVFAQSVPDASVVADAGIVLAPIVDPKVPETDAEAGSLIGMLLDAAQHGHWTAFTGLLLLLLVWFFNRLGLAAKIGTKFVPWVTLGISTLVMVAVSLATETPLLDALKAGLLEGGIAIALWELIMKHITNKKSDGTPRS